MQTHWRLAFMFDTASHDLAALEQELRTSAAAIRNAADGHGVRIGVADRHAELGEAAARIEGKGWADVDGAIEITIANQRAGEISDICRAMRPVLDRFSDPASVDVMAGPMFGMVPVRSGATFLSLAFRRAPAINSAQFRDWWYNQHAKVAIPVLGEDLLAYDQVHVEQPISQAAAQAFGTDHVEYDAYDNLTWADRCAYLHSISDQAAMAEVYADEVGRIDPTSRRSAMMTEVV